MAILIEVKGQVSAIKGIGSALPELRNMITWKSIVSSLYGTFRFVCS